MFFKGKKNVARFPPLASCTTTIFDFSLEPIESKFTIGGYHSGQLRRGVIFSSSDQIWMPAFIEMDSESFCRAVFIWMQALFQRQDPLKSLHGVPFWGRETISNGDSLLGRGSSATTMNTKTNSGRHFSKAWICWRLEFSGLEAHSLQRGGAWLWWTAKLTWRRSVFKWGFDPTTVPHTCVPFATPTAVVPPGPISIQMQPAELL